MADGTAFTLHGVALTSGDSGTPSIHHAWRAWPGATAVLGLERLDRAGLIRRIKSSCEDGRSHLWRFDTPLSIAHEHLSNQSISREWSAMAAWMASFPSARDWRRAMRATDRKELRRDCDCAHSAPLAPTNLRLFKQTWALITQIAYPLSAHGIGIGMGIEPCTPSHQTRVILCEANATSVLERAGVPASGFRGEGNAPMSRRESIVSFIRTRGIGLSPEVATRAAQDTSGDIVHALLMTTDPQQSVVPAAARLEGWMT